MKSLFILLLVSILISLCSCGKGIVSVTNESYEPKIVIEGFLTAGQTVDKIRIARNFAIDTNLETFNLIPNVQQTQVSVTDIEDEKTIDLVFHPAEDRR